VTSSLQPLVDEADRRLVLLERVTREACDRVAAEVTEEGNDSSQTRRLAVLLKMKWVIDLPPGWHPKTLDLAADVETLEPELMHRRDGVAMLYPGLVHWIYGEPESGKTWIVLQAAAEELAKGNAVLLIDSEMDERSIRARLKAMGVINGLLYVNPTGPMDIQGWSDFSTWLESHEVTLAIIDGVTEAMSLHSWDPNSNQDAASWGHCLRILARSGAAVVVIDHVAKNRETRGRGPVGAQHKLAGADVALEVRAKTKPDLKHPGLLQVFVRKDRMGALRTAANSADLLTVVDITPDNGSILIEFSKPPEGHSASVTDGGFKPTGYMQQVSEYVETYADAGGKLPSRNAIEQAVGGKSKFVRQAIDRLTEDGYLDEIRDGNARRCRFVKLYREGDDQ
jgi:hypothetical protein